MRFVFTCGGTAGHINPALAVAGRLRELMPDCEILFLGAEGKMEMDLVPREGYEIKGLRITNISRERSLEGVLHNIDTVKNVALSLHDARKLIRDFKPDAVIGTGGYVCYPVLTAAAELHIPTAVHESNAVPGLTTRMLAERVDCIMLGFEESRRHYSRPQRVHVTGTPVRGEFDRYTREAARAELGLAEDERLVVSVWGSLGAGHMNEVLSRMIPLLGEDEGFRLVHAAGGMYYGRLMQELSASVPDLGRRHAEVREYIYDMPRLMAAADLVLCRAGASTISELCYMGKPVIMVPSPNVTDNHQEKNARVLERAGGAKVLLEGEFDEHALLASVRELLRDGERLDAMSGAMSALSRRDAADSICSLILDLLG